ncbi:hypothetical protein [Edaphobacter modestus]|uniref:Outer membrane protein beta-barrel domain-containing protein n=1 Tax=Edaphobacter modestus TaxID=388466 RepID=A0A4Q7YQE1_9BACT|nr:hypothetical protein [Edaphobacter modestus]RZU39690.1 hypothetical protein BDD14_1079 [Edaphobacter modestus]
MKLLFSAVLSALFLLPVASHAQIGIYLNPVATRVSNSQADTGPFAFLGEGTTSRTFWGVNMGGYYDFAHGKNVDAGIDIRDTTVGANNARMNSFLVGVRVVAKTLSPSWRPYVQLSGGVGTTRAPHTSIRINRARYGIFAGADYKLNRFMDLKAFEIGYGSLTTVSNAAVGNTTTSYPASNLFEASAGLVFRIR